MIIKYAIEYYDSKPNRIRLFVDIPLREHAKQDDTSCYEDPDVSDCFDDDDDDDEDEFIQSTHCDNCGDVGDGYGDEDCDKYKSFESELRHICGMENLMNIKRYEINFVKGERFKLEAVVNDIMIILLQRFCEGDGEAKEIELPVILNKDGEKSKKKYVRKKRLKSIILYENKVTKKKPKRKTEVKK